MANLPIFQTGDQNLTLIQNKWSSILNPVLSNPGLNSSILSNVQLTTGTNTINHLLGRKLQGWRLVRIRGPVSVYDDQDSNVQNNLTLILISNASCSVDLEVF